MMGKFRVLKRVRGWGKMGIKPWTILEQEAAIFTLQAKLEYHRVLDVYTQWISISIWCDDIAPDPTRNKVVTGTNDIILEPK